MEKGLMPRMEHKPYWYLPEMPNYSKVIFLNKENLADLEGYKATIEMFGGLLGKQEIHIVLTGFSWDSAKALFDKLKAMNKDEIYSDKGKDKTP
jgi:hypothetical protein